MRTGAIFARGSCRALKWMALLGVVFALGAAQAAAQPTPDPRFGGGAGGQDGFLFTVGGKAITSGDDEVTVVEGSALELRAQARGMNTDTSSATVTIAITLAPRTADPDGNPTDAEPTDYNFNPGGTTATLTLEFPAEMTAHATRTDSVSLYTVHDDDAEDEEFFINYTVTGWTTTDDDGDPDVRVIIDDNEIQRYTLSEPSRQAASEGDPFNVVIRAEPEHEDLHQVLTLHLDDPSYYFTDPTQSRLSLGDAADDDSTAPINEVTVEITPPMNDGNRVPDTVTLTAYSARRNAEGRFQQEGDPLEVTVADDHTLPDITVTVTDEDGDAIRPARTTVMEGEKLYLTVTASRPTTARPPRSSEKVTVTLMPTGTADRTDYTFVSAHPIQIAGGSSSTSVEMFELMVRDDDDDVGRETLVFDAMVAGDRDAEYGDATHETPNVLSLTVEDATTPLVSVKEGWDGAIMEAMGNDPLIAGGQHVDIPTGDLFEFDDNAVSVVFATSVEGDADVVDVWYTDGYELVRIFPRNDGEVEVSLTATATPLAGSFDITQNRANIAKLTFPVTVVNSDLMVTVAADPMEIMEGGTSTITATANRMVESSDGDVTINLAVVGDGTLDMDTIAIEAGAASGSAMLTATEDDDDYMDETVTVVASGSGIDGTMQVGISVDDNDEAPVDESTVRAKDGAADMVASAIAKAAGDADWMVGGMVATVDMSELFDVDDGVTAVYSGGSSNEDVVRTMTTGATMLALTPMGAGSATITVTASDQAGGGVATVMHDAMVALQTLMVEVTASAHMVDEGESVTLTAKANRVVTADTMLTLTVTGDSDAVEVPESLTLGMGEDMGTAMVMAMEDDDAQDEMVTVVVTGAGLASPVSIEIGVTDNDRTVVAKSGEQVNAVFVTAIATASGSEGWLPGGDAAMVDMSDLFTTNGDPALAYTAESSAEEMVTVSANGPTLTLTPMATGSATITVTATDTRGDADDHATVMADVEVGVVPLMIELHGPDDMNLVEGMSYEIKAMANRAVTEDTAVEIMRDRAESSAGGDDYSVENITIAAGESMGATMLMVTDDGPGDSGAGMPEKLMLYGMVGNMQTNSLSFYLWDAAVPALPVIAQLLLAAFLAAGGYRRYRRR